MCKFALFKNFSFNFTNEFSEFSNHSKFGHDSIAKDVAFVDFDNTVDLITKIATELDDVLKKFPERPPLDVLNCLYTKDTLIQGFYVESGESVYEKIIFVKRKILNDDSYTYVNFDPSDDKFEYLDMQLDDIVKIIKGKYVSNALVISSSGNIKNIECMDTYDDASDSGVLKISHDEIIREVKYLNVKNILKKFGSNEPNEEELSKILSEKIDSTGSTYVCTQLEFSLGLLNCYCEVVAMNKNDVISGLMDMDVYGDVIITLENHLNDDSRLLDITPELFNKILDNKQKNFTMKNKYFCNVYYELL